MFNYFYSKSRLAETKHVRKIISSYKMSVRTVALQM